MFGLMTAADLIEQGEQARSRGDEAAALAAFEEAAHLAHTVFDPALEARAMLAVGQLRALREEPLGAREALQEAAARAMEAGDLLTEADAHLAMAVHAFDAGQSKDGHDALLEAMALYRQIDAEPGKTGLARATRMYGEHLGVLGSESDARQALLLARVMFADLGDDLAVQGIDEDLRRLVEFSR
jgi:tetratricopeptide (TPR) repeat protein